MPIYSYECDCGAQQEMFSTVANRDRAVPQHCGLPMRRVILPAYAVEDIQPYKSMITGEMITSRSQHRAHLKQHGCEEVGNEFNKPIERKLRGDFNNVEELKRATHDVMRKYRG